MFEKNKNIIMWAVGLFLTGGGGTYFVKGITADAVSKAEAVKELIIKERDDEIKLLEKENDQLSDDAIIVGFRYDLCCSGSPCTGQ